MFNFFKKTQQERGVSPADGIAIPLESVNDQMFSQGMMGKGYGIKPESDELFAPFSGEVVSVFPTKHAYTMKTQSGLEILVHLGIDTVELKGVPFALNIEAGQSLEAGARIGSMNRDLIKSSSRSDEIIVVITNMDKVKNVSSVTERAISHGDEVVSVSIV